MAHFQVKHFIGFFFATNKMSMVKEIGLLAEYDTDTCLVGEKMIMLRKLIPVGLQLLYDYLGLEPLFGKSDFYYDPDQFSRWFEFSKGGGIAPMVSGFFTDETVDYRVCNSGKKAVLIEATWRYFHSWIISLMQGMPKDYIDFQVIRQKQEWKRKLDAMTDEELRKIYIGMREFFIPSLFHQMYFKLIMQPMLEICCMNILIGTKSLYGGYEQIARYLNCFRDGMVFNGGDFTKFDKNVQTFIIQAFVGTCYMMYNKTNLDAGAKRFIRMLFEYYMYHSCTKIVLHLGSFFRIERGKVNSGAFDTSLLNSFAALYMFCLYIAYTMQKMPHLEAFFRQAVAKRLINKVVYGDDHLWCSLQKIMTIFNVRLYSQFLKKYFNIDLREVTEFFTLFSDVNWRTGVIVKQRAVLLKRVFVLSPYPETARVLAFKDIRLIMVSLCSKEHCMSTNSGPLPIELIMSALGQMYDCQTNFAARAYVKRFVEKVKGTMHVLDPDKALREYMMDPANSSKINKLMRQIGTTEKNLLLAFPSKKEMLRRSKYDPERCMFGRALREVPENFMDQIEVR